MGAKSAGGKVSLEGVRGAASYISRLPEPTESGGSLLLVFRNYSVIGKASDTSLKTALCGDEKGGGAACIQPELKLLQADLG